MKAISNRVPRGFRNLQSLHLKTVDSIALPIYNSLPPLPTKLPVVGEEGATPIVKKIRLDEDSEGQSEAEDEILETASCKQVEEEAPAADSGPESTVKKSKRLKVSDYVDATMKRSTALTPITAEIRGGVKRKVSSLRKLLGTGQVRTLSAKKIRGSTVISSKFEKVKRKQRRRTMD